MVNKYFSLTFSDLEDKVKDVRGRLSGMIFSMFVRIVFMKCINCFPIVWGVVTFCVSFCEVICM